MGVRIESDGEGGALVSVKAVPGARRDEVGGALGERLKVRTSAPPEGGKANKAIEKLLAAALGVRASDVRIAGGHTNPEKVFRVRGVSPEDVRKRLT